MVRGQEVVLTSREFEILACLAEHPGWVFSADQLSCDAELGGYSPESVSVHISRLRHKLLDAGVPDVVETVRGFGYRLRPGETGPGDGEVSELAEGCQSLRDAAWQLQQATFEVEHSGSPEQRDEAAKALDDARRTLFSILAR